MKLSPVSIAPSPTDGEEDDEGDEGEFQLDTDPTFSRVRRAAPNPMLIPSRSRLDPVSIPSRSRLDPRG